MLKRFPSFRRGQNAASMSATELQNMADTVAALSNIRGGHGIDVQLTEAGCVISAQQVNPLPRGDGAIIACKITTIGRNHLTCTRNGGGGTIEVAKPRAARAPNSDGSILYLYQNQTFTLRDANLPAAPPMPQISERQIVLRRYAVNDEIEASRVSGGTGVTEAPDYVEVHSDRTWYREEPVVLP